ncbi:MAG: ECF transporter S component [Eubacteriales bacterium]|nr:ECF transporter S component [Eubacteriales bacterium]
MSNKHLKNMVLSAMFLAIGLVLPLLTGQIQKVGNMLLPMHIPVLLCGLICGWQYGLVVGIITPIMRSLLFTMPVMYPVAIGMSFELATYGLVIGLLYSKSKWKCVFSLYRSMIIAMLAGRIVWGVAQVILLGIKGNAFTFELFITNGFVTAIPGIILQLVLIPTIMVALNRANLVPFSKDKQKGTINV